MSKDSEGELRIMRNVRVAESAIWPWFKDLENWLPSDTSETAFGISLLLEVL